MYITSLVPHGLHIYSVHGILQTPLIYTVSQMVLYNLPYQDNFCTFYQFWNP